MEEIQSFPLQWPLGWKRTLHPGESKFKRDKTISSACKEITKQLAIMRATHSVLSSNIPVKADGMPYSTYKQPADKGVAVYFNLKGSPHVLACDKWNSIEHNLWAIAKHIESLRDQERWGVGNLEQAFAGFKALPERTEEPWYKVLGFEYPKLMTEEDLNNAYKILAKKYHPDMPGGSEAMMQRINEAKEEARKYLEYGG
jgi:hypothetical protein